MYQVVSYNNNRHRHETYRHSESRQNLYGLQLYSQFS
nr:MAG TPA_asm: hypothetical protein [Caudoviricetes sp.]